MFVKLAVVVVVVLVVCLLQTACRRRAEARSDFKRWASDPEAREEITRQMLEQQDLFAARRARTEARQREMLAADAAEFDRFLRGLDLADLARHDDEYGSESPSEIARDRLHGALLRLVFDGDLRRWDTFAAILDSQAIYGADAVVRSAVRAMTGGSAEDLDPLDAGADPAPPAGATLGEFHDRLCSRILEKARNRVFVSEDEIATCLMIDPARTLPVILDPAVLDIASFEYACALRACIAQRTLPDVVYLRATLAAGKARLAQPQSEGDEKRSDHLGSTVALLVSILGRQRAENIEQEALSLLKSFRFECYDAMEIAGAVAAQYGIDDMDEYMSQRYEKELKRSFPFDQGDELFQTWVAVSALDGQVRNGGFTQYFGNGYGYQFPAAIAAFERLGEKEVCGILTRIRDAFDARKPAGDYSAEKLQQVFDRVEKLLDESDGAYYGTANHAYAKLILHLLDRIKAERAATTGGQPRER